MRRVSAKPLKKHPERRVTERREVDLAALVRVGDHPWIACRVMNISPMGARLEFEQPTILPRYFRLQIPADLFEVECDLRHQSGPSAGVQFISNRNGALARYA